MLVMNVLLVSLTLLQGAGRADTLPPRLAASRDALAAGKVERALALAKDYTQRHSDDERGFLLLGDAYMKRDVTGRYPAWRAYWRAEQLAPDDPAAPYGQAMAGWFLGPPDGERLAREGLERVLAIDPVYRDTWEKWTQLYRDDNGRRNIIAILEKHRDMPEAAGRIAQMELELGDDSAADSVLTRALAKDSTNPMLLALAAQRAFDRNDSLTGWRDYQAALAHADHDSTDFLWYQAMPIASPDEIQEWKAGIPADRKPGWLESFWARRNPDLSSPINHRVGEQFQRLRYALHKFDANTHPLGRAMRSKVYRDIHLQVGLGELKRYFRCESTEEADGRASRYVVSPGFTMDALDSTITVQEYERISGRGPEGVAYLRFGAPKRILMGAASCFGLRGLIRWVYPWGELRFADDPDSGNQMALRPLNVGQVAAARHMLRHDASSVPNTLDFGVWTAQFRDTAVAGQTDLQVYATADQVAAALVGAVGGSHGTVRSRSSHVQLRDRPGRYALLVNAADMDARDELVRGRQRLAVTVRDMRGPAMSDLLLGPAWPDSATTRASALQHVIVDLTFTSRDTIRAYSELYGLATEGARTRYQATYDVLKTAHPNVDAAKADWSHGVAFTFVRNVTPTADGIVREVLDLGPKMVGRGTFLLRLRITDLLTGRELGQTTSQFIVQ